jgi:phage-related baseplate assembly protein
MTAPNLTGQTAESIRAAAFSKWQALANEPAAVGTPEYIMLELLSFLCALNNAGIQQGLEGGLINYSLGDRLNEIGILFGITRLLNESDDSYRQRILLAPAGFSTAGSPEAIKRIVKEVSPLTITDVSSVTGTPSTNVTVRFITKTGLPDSVLIAKVLAALQNPMVKPTCVSFTVTAPTVVNYTIAANITTYSNADIATLPARCAEALNRYIAGVRAEMGRDVVVNQIVGVLQGVAGVYKAVLTSPAADIIVQPTEWGTAPDATASSITLVGATTG